MVKIDESYLKIIKACKSNGATPVDTQVRNAIAEITGSYAHDLCDSDVTYWLSQAVEAIREYAPNIKNTSYMNMATYISKDIYFYKLDATNINMLVNRFLINQLMFVKIGNKNDEWESIFEGYDEIK